MNTKHTPGPWEVRPSSNKENGTAWRDIVATSGEFSPAYVGEALEHDARLIAAAPDMLAALETIARQCGQYATHQPALDYATIGNIARAAIAKATGNE